MPVPLLVGAIVAAAAGCVTVIGTFGTVIAKKVIYRKYLDEFDRLWKEKVDVQELLGEVDLLKKETATCRDHLGKIRRNEIDKLTGRLLREEVDMLEKEIATYRDHLERVRRIEIEKVDVQELLGEVDLLKKEKVQYRKYLDEFDGLWKEIATCRAHLTELLLMEIEKGDVQELLEEVDLLMKEIATCRDHLEKIRRNEIGKVSGRMLREEVDMIEKEIATFCYHLERVRRNEKEIATHREHLAELKEIGAMLLKEEQYMAFLDDAEALNMRRNVRKGREFLSGGLFREVAVKMILKSDRAQKELAVLQKLDHENIVKFIDFDEIETKGLCPHLYIIMELCDCDLTTFMEKRNDRYLSIETFSLISKQLLGGLEYLHRNGFIHRDIKPDNILVIQDKTFKYSDFGITKEIPDGSAAVTQTRNGIGSDGYRAPETYRDGIVRISKSVDIFSLAIVLAQLISKGKHPYGTNHHFWKTNIMCGEKLDLSIVGVGIREKKDQLIDVLTQMLSTDPEGRPSVEDIRNHTFFLNETRVVSGECIICYGFAATTAFIPCGHVHVCPDCAPRLDECPTCRAKIIRPMRVYPI